MIPGVEFTVVNTTERRPVPQRLTPERSLWWELVGAVSGLFTGLIVTMALVFIT